MAPWLGIVADDTTGACDVAGGLAELGVTTTLLLGVPEAALASATATPATHAETADCIVVGLTTRMRPAEEAVAESLTSARWLLAQGATQIYQKYCSTFDSTDRGNIGPVAEALADEVGSGVSVGTPATPRAGRTQYCGYLFVDGLPLAESPMREHPLTPMTDSNLVRVLGRQATRPVTLRRKGDVLALAEEPQHVLVDATEDGDLDVLAAELAVLPSRVLVGGGAGLALALARLHGGGVAPAQPHPMPLGGRLILCGSGSSRTREQIADFSGPVLTLDPLRASEDEDAELALLMDRLARLHGLAPDQPVLVASATEPGEVRAAQQRLGVDRAAAVVERTLGALAVRAVDELGIRRLIVAGGETSGAVTAALGLTRLSVRGLAAPGVPWTVGERADGTTLALLLKSGNFGGADLFTTAWGSGR